MAARRSYYFPDAEPGTIPAPQDGIDTLLGVPSPPPPVDEDEEGSPPQRP